MSPSVSVVIGAFNSAAWIRETLDSVLRQSRPVSEILVVDDGSTDETGAIVQSYGPPLKYFKEQHRGRPHRNRGILESHGDFVAFLDADDVWDPRKLELQMEAITARGGKWIISDSQWLDSATGRISSPVGEGLREGDILEALFLNNFIVASSVVVSRSVLDEVRCFDESERVAPVEDWELWLRIAARCALVCVPERLVTLRLHEDSFLASTPIGLRVQAMEHVIELAVERQPARLSGLRPRALANVYHSAAVQLFRRGDLVAARNYFLRSWRQRPGDPAIVGYILLSYLGPKVARVATRLKQKRRRA